MRVLARLIPRSPTFRYMLAAVLAFALGSATVVEAANSGAVTLPMFRLADGVNPNQLAAIDADGNVHVSVSNQPSTQEVSGTVSVSNFPSTQNVNVTGGTVKTNPAVATKGVARAWGPLGAGDEASSTFASVNASYIGVLVTGGDVDVTISGSLGTVFDNILGDNQNAILNLTQQIPVDSIHVSCENVIEDCRVQVFVFGN